MTEHHSPLTFDEYQEQSGKTALPISPPVGPDATRAVYNALAMAGEAGEIAGKVSKALRDNKGHISDELRRDLLKECGDLQWHLVQFVAAIGASMASVALMNLAKLRSRQERGVLGGSGDNR